MGAVLFADLTATSRAVAGTAARLGKIERMAGLLARLPPDEIEAAVSFLSGTTRQGRIGIGPAAMRAAADAPAADHPSLTITAVDRAFEELAALEGRAVSSARARALRALFARATADEQAFLRRLLLGELRQGALAGVLTDAVARAAGGQVAAIRRAVMMQGDLAQVARIALVDGPGALAAAGIRLLRPIQPMLAASAASLDEAIDDVADPVVELKLDGARVQVHKSGDEVRLYSRTLNDVSASAPDVVARIRALPARELILDGEVLVLRPDASPQPFQVTMRRFGRTRDVERLQHELPLTPFLFDVLYLDGQSLVDEPLARRTQVLDDVAAALAVPRLIRPDAVAASAFAADALARGHEGIMVKDLAAPYAAGRRGSAWIKVKQARTLDLVVLAAEWGSGRRQGWLSNLHLGARDAAAGGFVMLGKTFKGLTDEMLRWQTAELLAREIGRDQWTVHVRPELVVEIAFNEIQTSPVYPGGLALRFARVRRYRGDKTAATADSIETVRRLAGVT